MSRENQRCARYHGRLQAVILDWAGTTVDFGSLAPVRTLQRVFARVNISLTEPEVRRDMGLPKKDHIRRILAMERISVEWKRVLGHLPGEPEVEELYQRETWRACLKRHSRRFRRQSGRHDWPALAPS